MSVPKIIHQLWIGDKPPPLVVMSKVKNMNPDFEYVFWNEEKLEKDLVLPKGYLRKIKSHEAINGKADMYRYLILLQYGGVWVDADIIPIEPLDDFLLNTPFFCFENEIERLGLCANTILAFPKDHVYMQTLVDWILQNETREKQAKMESWNLVGPGLLTRAHNSLKHDPGTDVTVFPSYYFLPDHHSGRKYLGHGKVYTTHEWGTTWDRYDEIDKMDIPSHHKQPKKSIDITINPTSTKNELKEIMNGCKNMIGNFKINIIYDGELDILKYLKSSRFIFLKL